MYQHFSARECQRTGDARVRKAWTARQDAKKDLTPRRQDAKVKRFEREVGIGLSLLSSNIISRIRMRPQEIVTLPVMEHFRASRPKTFLILAS
jgi:hypothetical protein